MSIATPLIDTVTATYQDAAGGLPGADLVEVTTRRQMALDAFRRYGLPDHKLESWKFTSLSGLEKQVWRLPANDGRVDPALLKAAALSGETYRLVFINGRFDAAASRLSGLPAGAQLQPLSSSKDVADALGDVVENRDTVLGSLNAALASDGVVLEIADGVVLDRPVEIVVFGAPAMVNLRHAIRLGRNARAVLVESYRDGGSGEQPGWTNIFAGIEVGEGAELIHLRLQGENTKAYHAALGRVSVGENARYAHVSVQAGGAVVRHELHIDFAGRNAEIDVKGLVLARGISHIDHTLRLHHAVPDCRSNQLFKHVVDERGHAVFQGGICVAPHAQKTDARQLSRTLLLADRAQIDTKPELEILADDVKCSHGASIGDLDAQQIFYMQARGMDQDEARRLLLSGFAYEIVAGLPAGALHDHACDFIEAWLKGGAA